MTRGFEPRPVKIGLNRGGYETQFADLVPNGFVPLFKNQMKVKNRVVWKRWQRIPHNSD